MLSRSTIRYRSPILKQAAEFFSLLQADRILAVSASSPAHEQEAKVVQNPNIKKLRKIFFVDDVIAGDQVLSKSAKNFVRHKKLYPFLLGEKAYTDIQGFSAKRYIKQVV